MNIILQGKMLKLTPSDPTLTPWLSYKHGFSRCTDDIHCALHLKAILLTIPQTPRYVPALPTKENLQYADLTIIDLSKAATAEGRAELAVDLREALTTHGFCYIINHGYTQAQNERMFDIADIPMSGVPEEEKRAYAGDSKKTGLFQGYKPRQYWHIDAGVRDQHEHYNCSHTVKMAERN